MRYCCAVIFFIVWPISIACSQALAKIWRRLNAGITTDTLHHNHEGELWYLHLFSYTKIVVFYYKFHWKFFLMVQLTTPDSFLIQAVQAGNNFPRTEYEILIRVHKCFKVHLLQIAEHNQHSKWQIMASVSAMLPVTLTIKWNNQAYGIVITEKNEGRGCEYFYYEERTNVPFLDQCSLSVLLTRASVLHISGYEKLDNQTILHDDYWGCIFC